MPYETLSEGLTLTIPTSGTTNWGAQTKNLAWKVISQHRHEGSGDGNKIRPQGMSGQFTTKQTLTPTGTTQAIDFDSGGMIDLNLGSASGNVTVTFANAQSGMTYTIKIIQGATARVVTWPSGILWEGGEEATQHHNINTTNLVWLRYDGTNYLSLWQNEIS